MKELLKSISGITKEKRSDIILAWLERMDIPYEIQKDENATNIILFPDNLRNRHVTFTAHYDIWPGSCGANDNGSSIVILLRLAAYINKELNKSIVIVFLDREESGGHGCRLFFSQHKDTSLVINLDVCGSGDRIVISDEASLRNPFAGFFRNAMTEDMLESDMFPYCDGRNAERMGFDVWSVSVFPENDARRMSRIRMTEADKLLIRSHSKEAYGMMRKYMPPFDLEILRYMHTGRFDSIKYINFDIMECVYSYIKEASDGILSVPNEGPWLSQKEINRLLKMDSIDIIRKIYGI